MQLFCRTLHYSMDPLAAHHAENDILHTLNAKGTLSVLLPSFAENDFILAAKLDGINKEGLLRGKKKYFADV